MPLARDADLGLRLKGPPAQRKRRILVLDTVARPLFDQTLCDISGLEIAAHRNETGVLMKAVRDWLIAGRDGGASPGAAPSATTMRPSNLVPEIIAQLRRDSLAALLHSDLRRRLEPARPPIAAARAA